jgi:hypothetical protein
MADGWYLSDVPGIALDDRLTRIQRRCVLAHELAHIDLDHHDQVAGCGPGSARLARRNEVAADRLAARRLIRLDDLISWLPYAAGSSEAAELLDVTEQLLGVRLAALDARERGILDRALRGVGAAA